MVLEVSRMRVKVERDRLSCVSVIKMQAQLVQVVSSISIDHIARLPGMTFSFKGNSTPSSASEKNF